MFDRLWYKKLMICSGILCMPLVSPVITAQEVPFPDFSKDQLPALQKLIDEGHCDQAEGPLEQLLEKDPSIHQAWSMLGWCYWKSGDPDKAIALWKRLQFIDPDLPLSYNLLARAAIEQDDLPRAISNLRKSLSLDPNQEQTVFNLARVLRWNSNFPESIKLLEQLTGQYPDDHDMKLELARAYTSDWAYEKALPLWKDLVAQEPGNIEFVSSLALCELHTGDSMEALQHVDRLLEEDPEQIKALEVAITAAELSDQPEDALDPLRKLLEKQPTEDARERVRVRLIRLLVRLNEMDPKKYPLNEVIELAQERTRLHPDSPDAFLLLGELYTLDGQLKKAEEPFTYVLENLNPYNRRAHRGLFEVYVAQKKIGDAWEELGKLGEFNPYDPYLHYYEARLQEARGDLYKARQALDKLEQAGSRGAVACLLYHGLTPSPFFADALYVERFRDHMQALIDAGVEFVRAEELPDMLGTMASNTGKPGTLTSTPSIKVLVDFDDARRDSMKYGTMIAKELGLVFSMHIPVGYILENNSFICTWEQLREYHKTGCWEYGSHLLNAAILAPFNAAGKKVHRLPNRIWLTDEKRNETRTEYLKSLDNEFKLSRSILQQELGGSFSFFSYPFGDLGQEDITNVENPSQTILLKAQGAYDVGFIQSQFGYAIAGDNPLLYQRHEIDRWRSGSNLVEYIYKQHPVFLARRTRAEFAALEGKQYLALSNLKQLREDGYPESLLAETEKYVYHRLAGRLGSPVPELETAEEKPFWAVDVEKPFVGIGGEYFRDNQTRRNWLLEAYGGLNITPQLRLEANAGYGHLKQVVSNTNIPGITEETELNIDLKQAGAAASYTFMNGTYILGDLTLKDYSGDATQDEAAYAFETQFRPFLALDIMLRYEHDMVPSALAVYQDTTYDAPIGYSVLRLRDWWEANLSAARYDFSDDNLRNHFRIGSYWTLWERPGLNLGINYAYASADHDDEAYWTPYKLNRYFMETGFKGNYLRTYYNIRFRLGLGKEKVRSEEEEQYRETLDRAIRDNWEVLPEEPEEEGWQTVIGGSLSLRIPIQELLNTRINASYNKLPNYNEFNFDGGLELTF